jgi:hypothetical protein
MSLGGQSYRQELRHAVNTRSPFRAASATDRIRLAALSDDAHLDNLIPRQRRAGSKAISRLLLSERQERFVYKET